MHRPHTPITEALAKAAAAHGRAIAASSDDRASASDALDRSLALLAEHGYEPRQVGRTVLLTNCPFHSLARSHTELVCHMNEALLAGFAESIAPDLLEARLEPGEDRCCVILTENV